MNWSQTKRALMPLLVIEAVLRSSSRVHLGLNYSGSQLTTMRDDPEAVARSSNIRTRWPIVLQPVAVHNPIWHLTVTQPTLKTGNGQTHELHNWLCLASKHRPHPHADGPTPLSRVLRLSNNC